MHRTKFVQFPYQRHFKYSSNSICHPHLGRMCPPFVWILTFICCLLALPISSNPTTQANQTAINCLNNICTIRSARSVISPSPQTAFYGRPTKRTVRRATRERGNSISNNSPATWSSRALFDQIPFYPPILHTFGRRTIETNARARI